MAKGKCQYCGIESGNIKMHERYCEKNPGKEVATPPHQSAQPLPIQIRISGIQDILDTGFRAWFNTSEGKIPLIPLKCGTVCIYDPKTKASEEFVSILVLTVNGSLLPPSMIAGFMGVFPEDMVFPEPITEQPAKPQAVVQSPEVAPEVEPPKSIISKAEEKLKAFAEQPPEPKPTQEAKPKSVSEKLRDALKKA